MIRDKSGGQRPPLNNPARELSVLSESDGLEANRTRNLQLLRAGSFQLAIFEDEIATTVEWRDPAPLPYAPKSVLGVVSIQGRMLTVLDLRTLLSAEASPPDGPQQILALRGDEQLALVVDALGETIEIADGKVETAEGLFFGFSNIGIMKLVFSTRKSYLLPHCKGENDVGVVFSVPVHGLLIIE